MISSLLIATACLYMQATPAICADNAVPNYSGAPYAFIVNDLPVLEKGGIGSDYAASYAAALRQHANPVIYEGIDDDETVDKQLRAFRERQENSGNPYARAGLHDSLDGTAGDLPVKTLSGDPENPSGPLAQHPDVRPATHPTTQEYRDWYAAVGVYDADVGNPDANLAAWRKWIDDNKHTTIAKSQQWIDDWANE